MIKQRYSSFNDASHFLLTFRYPVGLLGRYPRLLREEEGNHHPPAINSTSLIITSTLLPTVPNNRRSTTKANCKRKTPCYSDLYCDSWKTRTKRGEGQKKVSRHTKKKRKISTVRKRRGWTEPKKKKKRQHFASYFYHETSVLIMHECCMSLKLIGLPPGSGRKP